MLNIYLIRHAQAQGNLQRRFQGRTDTPLTGLGEEQARRLAARFASMPLEAVYASPLIRSRQTALALSAPYGITPVIIPGITEIDGGGLENLSFEEIAERYPDQFDAFNNQPHLFTGVGGGEGILSVYERIIEAMRDIASRHSGGNIAVVSHGCAIRCFLCFARAYPLENLGEVEWVRNTGVSHITYADGRFLLHESDSVSHLKGSPEMAAI